MPGCVDLTRARRYRAAMTSSKTPASKAAKKLTSAAGGTKTSTQGADLDDLDFEAALAELDTVVASMESGDLSLESSLAAFERGVRLSRHCQQALKDAELRVKQLTADGTLMDFDEHSETDPGDD